MKVQVRRNRIRRVAGSILLILTVCALSNCGGSGSRTQAPNPTPGPSPSPSPSPSNTAPSITTQPQSQTVTAPATATFSVAATGTTPLSYQWNKDRNPISGATSPSYTTPPTAAADNGEKFTVVITNSAGTVTSSAASLTVSTGSLPAIPQFSHVFIVLEENHSFSDVIGNSNMPYLNSLASANGLATQYYADAHPSLPNYFELTVGEGTSITGTSGDSYDGVVTQDNVVRALTAAGKTWKSYAESLPSVGYLGGDSGPYLQHHNPVVYFSDVQQSSPQADNVVPFTQLTTDIANNSLPDYGFIVPNVDDDAHNCPAGMPTCTDTQKLAAADQWLSTNIAPLLASSAFQNSLLIIVFDEAEDTDTTHGGGHVPAILISPMVRSGFQSTTLYQHESTLRLMMEALGVTDLPGAAAGAPDMTEFFP